VKQHIKLLKARGYIKKMTRRLTASLPFALRKRILTTKRTKERGETPLTGKDNLSCNQKPLDWKGGKNDTLELVHHVHK
jgi:hypothetical protein